MSHTDSMILIEVAMQTFENRMFCKDFDITAKFSNVFTMTLKKPPCRRKRRGQDAQEDCKKSIDIDIEDLSQTDYLEMKLKTGEAVLVPTNVLSLSMQMKTCPIDVTLWRKDHRCTLGSSKIIWSPIFWSYLQQAYNSKETYPVTVVETVDFYSDTTFKLVATAKMKIKVSYLRYKAKPSLSISTPVQLEPLSLYPDYKKIRQSFKEAVATLSPEVSFLLPDDEKPYIIEDFDDLSTQPWTGKNSALLSTKPLQSQPFYLTEPDHLELNRLTILSLTKSETNLNVDDRKKMANLTRSRSASALNMVDYCNPLDYIFLNRDQPFADQQYTVGYMTDTKPGQMTSQRGQSDKEMCGCKSAKACLFADGTGKITDPCVVHCKGLPREREMLTPQDGRVFFSFSKPCHGADELQESMKDKKLCECTCDCNFIFASETVYCKICGGYETVRGQLADPTTHPCPIFHNLGEPKNTNIVSKKKKKPVAIEEDKEKEGEKPVAIDKNKEHEDKDRELDESRFKFNYGYQAPHIGHANCGVGCLGVDRGPVPKTMGWLWTSENVPGLKFRPAWRPGAILKFVLKQLHTKKPLPQRGYTKHVADKKKKKEAKKKTEKKPMLVVTKKDGEYLVTMETAKIYPKPRLLNQYPYEDKPPMTYTIGRSAEENRDRARHLARKRRRLMREQRDYIQSAFRDVCKEICVKTYQQALGILPGFEDPSCVCPRDEPLASAKGLPGEHDDDCYCADTDSSDPSTDNDEWVVEFTPPNVKFQPGDIPKRPVTATSSTQYNYQDYKVKLVDRNGNPVPRFFKGPDGNTECSDLGGFWGPDEKWLEINQDGYIGPDGRWAPMRCKTPGGVVLDISEGQFQGAEGEIYVVGVDGWVDEKGVWRSYGRHSKKVANSGGRQGGGGGGRGTGGSGEGGGANARVDQKKKVKSEASWSCFGDAAPPDVALLGVTGHGHDKKRVMAALKDLVARDENLRIPDKQYVPRALPGAKRFDSHSYFEERYKCHHTEPSDKGIVAVDDQGNKTYFKINYENKNKRPKEREKALNDLGISLSSHHASCFRSFINAEIMKQQLRERRFRMAGIDMATQK